MKRRLMVTLGVCLVLLFVLSLPAFAADTVQVTFQAADGTYLPQSYQLPVGNLLPYFEPPLAKEELFLGWLYSTDGVNFSTEYWNLQTPIASDMVFRASVCAAFSGGHGTAAAPYLIATAEDLQLLSFLYQQKNALTQFAAYYQLTGNIVLNEQLLEADGQVREGTTPTTFVPIGSAETPFVGVFSGNGYTISGLYINQPNSDNIGLFGALANGSFIVSDLQIADAYVCGKTNVGLLAGSITDASYILTPLKNLTLSGTVVADTAAGGLCGSLSAASVQGVHVNVRVSATAEAGGLCGVMQSGASVSDASVQGIVQAQSAAGALCGIGYGGRVQNAVSDATVTAACYAGGGFGLIWSLPISTDCVLSDFTFSGTITAERFASAYIGLAAVRATVSATSSVGANVSGSTPVYAVLSVQNQLRAHMVSSENGISYLQNSLLSFSLTLRDGAEQTYRFTTSDLLAVPNVSALPVTSAYVTQLQVTNDCTTLVLTFPCAAEEVHLTLTFTPFGSEVAVRAAATLPTDAWSAQLYLGSAQTFASSDAITLRKIDTAHATNIYAKTDRALFAVSFADLYTGVAGTQTLCASVMGEAMSGYSANTSAVGNAGIYGYADLADADFCMLVSYRTLTAGTPVLLPVFANTGLADVSASQALFGGGVILLANGAQAVTFEVTSLTLGTACRLTLPAQTDDTPVFVPLTVWIAADTAAAEGSATVRVTADAGTALATIPLTLTVQTGVTMPTLTPQVGETTVTLPGAVQAYALAPNGAHLTWKYQDTTEDFSSGGKYWFLQPINGGYTAAELHLYIVRFETPYITAPAPQLVQADTPRAVSAPTVYNLQGYQFLGWFLADSEAPFDFATLVETDILLFGKWRMDGVVFTSHPTDVNKVFSPTAPAKLSFTYTHIREREITVTIAWYFSSTENGTFLPLAGETFATLSRGRVPHTGYYYAEVTATDGISTTAMQTRIAHLVITPLTVGLPTLSMPNGFPYTGYPLAVTFTDPYPYRTATGGAATELGTYTATVVLANEEDYVWADTVQTPVTVTWQIVRRVVPMPQILGNYVYNGVEQTPLTTTHHDYTVSVVSATLAGTYQVTFTLRDSAHTIWANAGTAPQTIAWVIAPRTPALTLYNTTKQQDGHPISIGIFCDSPVTPMVTYYQGETPLPAPPTVIGTYTVVVTLPAVSGQYAAVTTSAVVTISAPRYEVVFSDTTLIYNGNIQTPRPLFLQNGMPVLLSCTWNNPAEAILPGTYTFTLDTTAYSHAVFSATVCTLTILPKTAELPADFPTHLTMAETGAPVAPDLSAYLPAGITARLAPLPVTAGTHKILVSFAAEAGYTAPTARELVLTVLPRAHTSADGILSVERESGFAESLPNLLPLTNLPDMASEFAANFDRVYAYSISNVEPTDRLYFSASEYVQVYLLSADGTFVLCEGTYDAALGTYCLPAQTGMYLVCETDTVSPVLLVLAMGAGTTLLILAAVCIPPDIRKRKLRVVG